MNGGNCSSFCPVSRRRQKPLLPQQTMPLMWAPAPTARTSPCSVQAPIATRALGPQPGTLSQGRPSGSQGGLGMPVGLLAHGPRVYIHMAPRVLGAGGLAMARGVARQAEPPLLPASRQGREESINNSHTPETELGRREARVLEPASGGGAGAGSGRAKSPTPTHVASGYRLGALTPALNWGATRPGQARHPPALTKASGWAVFT